MTEQRTDRDLLRDVAAYRSQDAFAAIVERYLPLVHGAARRQVGEDTADDLTQAIFLLLWQRPDRVRNGAVLAGWLVNAARLAALQTNRTERRRRHREQIAACQRSLIQGDDVNSSNSELSQVLDKGLADLNENERTAIALRYLQDQSLEEVARAAGVSPSAAAKRVSRALERLRTILRKQGHPLLPAAMGEALIEIGKQSPSPTSSSAAVVNNAIANPSIASASIAGGITSVLAFQKITFVAMVVGLAAVLVGGGWVAMRMLDSTSAPQPAPLEVEQRATIQLIKVGITVSKWTAETDSPVGKPWGYDGQTRIAKDLTAPDMQLYPIIEPGSEKDDQLLVQLKKVFSGRSPIDGSDPIALKNLDVIVANEYWMAPDEVLAAFDKTVSGGVSLLNIGGMGWASPGVRSENPSPQRLTGLIESQGGYSSPVKCIIVNPHEILGPMAKMSSLSLKAQGAYGILPPDATPLIQVTDMSLIITRGPAVENPKFAFYPIYLSHLEKGKIVGIQISPFALPVRDDRTGLLLRSVRWLAGHSLQ